MGIAGLLPALRSIQKTKHLSEFKGQTIAVDAYVWLHKGVYACATDLAIGKPTHKYVDYAMHRVRLLRHFGVEPYVVFDGGPLPAKRGTESERKKRREENLARGKALIAQGRHSQARDCFVKCVDVTPEMAYQFIKALRPENVKYIVAPYEADAQLAYLERKGLVSAILTEDSDLLVFGCKNVLFKLDNVTNTVCHIARIDFGSVTSTALDSSSINLHGWNDTQFRAMAILSGCDYLPSIPGIGLKTANNLLRKWKTSEAVIRAVTLEGKKNVPNGYSHQYKLADKCFRFQRVYDPVEGRLVHLNDVEGEWDEEMDVYVGKDITPLLAKDIAMGYVDPVNHLPIKDVNPSFKPRAFIRSTKPPTASGSSGQKDKEKEKTGGLFNFFGPAPVIPKEKTRTSKADAKPALTGACSGKRSLGEILDQDIANRQQRSNQQSLSVVQSRFFSVPSPAVHPPGNKENIYSSFDEDEVEILSDLSLKANVSPTQDVDFDFPGNGVQQEDGYLSPLASYSQIDELSSPDVRIFTPLKKKKRKGSPRGGGGVASELADDRGCSEEDDDFDADPLSSPISTIKKKRRGSYSPTAINHTSYDDVGSRAPSRSFSTGNVLVVDTPARERRNIRVGNSSTFLRGGSNNAYQGPDLRSCLSLGDEEETAAEFVKSRLNTGELTSESGGEAGLRLGLQLGSVSPQSPLPRTPADGAAISATAAPEVTGASGTWELPEERIVIDVDALNVEAEVDTDVEIDDPEDEAAKIQTKAIKSVARAWRMKWAMVQVEEGDSSSSSASITSSVVKSKTKKSQSEKKRRQSAPMGTVTSKLRRNETNVTPLGRHSLAHTGTNRSMQEQTLSWSVPLKARPTFRDSDVDVDASEGKSDTGGNVRRRQLEKSSSLVFFAQNDTSVSSTKGKTTITERRKASFTDGTSLDAEDIVGSSDIEEISEETWLSLNRFRYR